jgi:hypothetical protein
LDKSSSLVSVQDPIQPVNFVSYLQPKEYGTYITDLVCLCTLTRLQYCLLVHTLRRLLNPFLHFVMFQNPLLRGITLSDYQERIEFFVLITLADMSTPTLRHSVGVEFNLPECY